MRLSTTLLFAAASASSFSVSQASASDKITSLPSAPAVDFDMYSGYVTLGSEDRHLFYWFAESQNDPSNDPVVLWTNGGPGCSGLGGFMTEQGPFRPTLKKQGAAGDDESSSSNGSEVTLEMNPYSWNKIANVIFIEQPAGVGFSYSESEIKSYTDALAAQDNHLFIKGWFEKFPQFAKNPFFLTSESYGGHYLPTLAKSLVDAADVPNFKGFAVGNPLTYMEYRNFGQYATYAGHQMVPGPTFEKYVSAGCRYQIDNVTAECNDLMGQMDNLTSLVDPYALDFPICTSDAATGRNERYALLNFMRRAKPGFASAVSGYFPDDYEPCDADWATTYLNRADVQSAIHVVGNVTWSDCNMAVNENYNQDDVNAPMMPIYEYLAEHGKDLNIMVYSGDDDSICATRGSQEWIWTTGGRPTSPWAPWTVDGQLGGYTVKFPGFRFTTIHGAGHMCPATRPAQTLEALRKYLSGEW